MSRYDDLSDRARWFLNNFDEIDLADICAAHEASNQTRQEALDRVRNLAEVWQDAPDPLVRASAADLLTTIRGPQPAAHNDGPSITEAAADDRRWWDSEKTGETNA